MLVQHIVLSCTNRKRTGTGAYPRLREVPPGDLATRASVWIDTVSASSRRQVVRDLYAGEYWQAGLGLSSVAARHHQAEVWAVSAGLGLVHGDDVVPAYAATFASRHPDSVVWSGRSTPGDQRRAWWTELAAWTGPGGGRRPRRLADLAATPDSRMLVCIGPDYVDAASDDLRAAHKILGDERLVVVGSSKAPPGVSDVWVRCPGKLRMRFGGSMASTGVRTARALIEQLEPSGRLNARAARDLVESWVTKAPSLPVADRPRLSDEELVAWIVADTAAHPDAATKSAALRRLRADGLACEQSRFGRIFARAAGGVS